MSTRVKVSMGVTINTGNFESMRVDIGIEDDARENEHVTDAYERVMRFVEGTLEKKVEDIRLEMSRVGR